jgi:peptide/nickel transport system ATP-binding protein
MAIIEVENLKVHFMTRRGPAKAVDNVGFAIKRNATLGLIGESGCGKTTMAMALMRFVKPPGRIVSGSIKFQGVDILKYDEELMR